MAQFGNTQLGNNLTNDFLEYAQDLQSYVNDIARTSKPEEDEAQRAVEFSSKDALLGIPDPVIATQSVQNNVIQSSISSNFEHNPALEAMVASNKLNREMTFGAVEGTLGINGQKQLQTKLTDTGTAIKDVDNYESSAREAERICEEGSVLSNLLETARAVLMPTTNTTTQTPAQPLSPDRCVAFQSLIIQSQQARMIAETFAQTAHVNQSLQYSNLNLANISQQMEEANRARRVDASVEAARLLRATSQVDLLGARSQDSEGSNQGSGVNTNPPSSP